MMPRNIPKPGATMNDAISIEGFRFPADRHYDREHHLWTMAEPDGACILVGLDALSLASLGDLAYVAVSEPGTEVARGESIGTLEAAKITGEIFAPLSGVVRRRNEPALRDSLPGQCRRLWLLAGGHRTLGLGIRCRRDGFRRGPGSLGAGGNNSLSRRGMDRLSAQSKNTGNSTGNSTRSASAEPWRLLIDDGVTHSAGLATDDCMTGRWPP